MGAGTGTVEILKLVAEGGAMVLLALVLLGIFYIALKWAPQFIAAWTAQTTALAELKATIAGLVVTVNEARSRASETSEDVANLRGALATGQHPAVSVERPERKPR